MTPPIIFNYGICSMDGMHHNVVILSERRESKDLRTD